MGDPILDAPSWYFLATGFPIVEAEIDPTVAQKKLCIHLENHGGQTWLVSVASSHPWFTLSQASF